MKKSERIYLFRIIHIDNLDFILNSQQITCPNHVKKDINYIGIGDTSLIRNRNSKAIKISPYGTFVDYVAFYFCSRPPMLYNIQNGYMNVEKRKPEDIIYLVTTFEQIKKHNCEYIFTDGHAYHNYSQFFNHEKDLMEIDWQAVKLKQWADTEEDPDRKRRKQAEFLIYQELPLLALVGIIVYNEAAQKVVSSKLMAHNLSYKIHISSNYYY